jgi:hypothetical protein
MEKMGSSETNSPSAAQELTELELFLRLSDGAPIGPYPEPD